MNILYCGDSNIEDGLIISILSIMKYDKCVYIDADTIIPGDISLLYNEDLKGNYLGCVVDKSTNDNEKLASYFEHVIGVPRDKYINSGVLLMDTNNSEN